MTLCKTAIAFSTSLLAATSVLVGAAVPAAANEVPRAPRAERTVGELLDGLGLPWGTVVNSWDLHQAADALHVKLDEPRVPHRVAHRLGLDELELWRGMFVRAAEDRLVAAQRETLRVPSMALGLDVGSTVDEADVRRLARHLGLDVGDVVSPTDVHNVDIIARREARVPTEVIATVGDLDLRAPARDIRTIGFHEAPTGEARLDMAPVAGMVMPSRGRSTHATSAVDVAMPAGTEVLSPISGVVAEVVNYRLYRRYDDTYVRIRGAVKDVVVLHVQGTRVRVGQKVEGGLTPIASSPRVFPFASQVEEFAGRHPHVDLTVRNRR